MQLAQRGDVHDRLARGLEHAREHDRSWTLVHPGDSHSYDIDIYSQVGQFAGLASDVLK